MSQRRLPVPTSTRLVLLGAVTALAVSGCGSTKTGSAAVAPPATTGPVAGASTSAPPPAVQSSAAGDGPASATPTSAAPTSATPTRPVAPAPTSGAPTSGRPTPVPTRTPGRSDRCHTSELSVRFGGGEGAAGTLIEVLVLTNTSPVTCTLYGYPGLQLLDARRHYLPTTAIRSAVAGGVAGPVLVTLRPGAQAHVRYSYNHVPTGTGSVAQQCPVSGYLEVTPPDETDFLLLRIALDPCNGRVMVAPVQAGGATNG